MRRQRWLLFMALAACLIGVVLVGQGSRERDAQVDGLSFAYPGDWTLTVVGHPLHYETVLAFLTSPGASAQESCGPDYIPGAGGGCTDTYAVPTGSAVVRLSQWDGPPAIRGPIPDLLDAGWQPVTIAGQAAAYTDHAAGAAVPTVGESVEWRIAAPWTNSLISYGIVATVNGQSAGLREQIDALLAALRIAPTGP